MHCRALKYNKKTKKVHPRQKRPDYKVPDNKVPTVMIMSFGGVVEL